MKQTEKQKYTAPRIEVIAVENEGNVMSGSLGGVIDGGDAISSKAYYSGRRSSYNTATPNDLEDLINDILTVEQ